MKRKKVKAPRKDTSISRYTKSFIFIHNKSGRESKEESKKYTDVDIVNWKSKQSRDECQYGKDTEYKHQQEQQTNRT